MAHYIEVCDANSFDQAKKLMGFLADNECDLTEKQIKTLIKMINECLTIKPKTRKKGKKK